MKVITITVNEEANVVSGSIADPKLSLDAVREIVMRIQAEAIKLLNTRASLRRFRRPVTLRFLDTEKRAPKIKSGKWELEDARGRKAFVRIEIEG